MENAEKKVPAWQFVADDVALDFLNTAYGKGAGHVDCFDSDQAVLDWLARAGVSTEFAEAPRPAKAGTLLQAALELRDATRDLIEKRKAGRSADVTLINNFLALAPRHAPLGWKKGQPPILSQVREAAGPTAVLTPVAEAVAKLLTEGDFELVRACEGETCTLWFYDRTKSHRRRWCDMAVCGNRAKVAAFRERSRAT
jgi:predicted RNA-binding Zn ribbon-like protein